MEVYEKIQYPFAKRGINADLHPARLVVPTIPAAVLSLRSPALPEGFS
jgi:hypothetical protein